jgi:hypothetical protein
MTSATLLLGLSILVQANTPSSGMVLALDGKVAIQRGTSQSNARLAELLRTGDRIRVETGNLTLMFCPSAERLVLRAGTTIELQATAIRVVAGPQPTRAAARCALPQIELGQESLEHIGGLRARGNPPGVLFIGGPLTTSRPVFEWEPVEGSLIYQLSLKNSEGDVIWQHQTSTTKVAYPATMPELSSGSYSWEVRAQAGGQTVAEQTANFEVKPANQLQTGNPTDSAAMLLEATILENAGYYAEAAAYYRELQKANSSDERISRHLAWLYWNAGLIGASNAQLQSAPK